MAEFNYKDATFTQRTSYDGQWHIQEATVVDDKTKKVYVKAELIEIKSVSDDVASKLASGEYTVERL